MRIGALLYLLKTAVHTLILSEHRFHYVRDSFDRLVFMEDGAISAVYDRKDALSLTAEQMAAMGLRPFDAPAFRVGGAYRQNQDDALQVSAISCMLDSQQILEEVSFAAQIGKILAIAGPNGAGKSTLSKLICGFETPEAGEIFLNGKPLAEENIRRRAQHIGYVMQNPNQMISKTMIYDEVALGLQRSGLTEEQIREKVEATLRVCGLYPFRNWPISALSFGQKKRVTIASVLVLDPELILLDEPTAGQDFRHYTDIMEFLRGLNARGVTVVMITHDMHLMLEYTRRALVFCDGRLIADRTAAAVLCDPALVEQAALKETSLYTLANRCGIAPAQEFVERFIEQDREVREGGC